LEVRNIGLVLLFTSRVCPCLVIDSRGVSPHPNPTPPRSPHSPNHLQHDVRRHHHYKHNNTARSTARETRELHINKRTHLLQTQQCLQVYNIALKGADPTSSHDLVHWHEQQTRLAQKATPRLRKATVLTKLHRLWWEVDLIDPDDSWYQSIHVTNGSLLVSRSLLLVAAGGGSAASDTISCEKKLAKRDDLDFAPPEAARLLVAFPAFSHV